jgi:hypothetical protein
LSGFLHKIAIEIGIMFGDILIIGHDCDGSIGIRGAIVPVFLLVLLV